VFQTIVAMNTDKKRKGNLSQYYLERSRQLELERIVNIVREYQMLSDLLEKGQRWIDNGLRVSSKVFGVPKHFKERGKALENELGRILDACVDDRYSLQAPIGEYHIADAIVKLKSGLFLRIEAKNITPEKTREYRYKNIIEWSNKYRNKPDIFYPYTLLYLNYEYYKNLTKEDFQNCIRAGLIISNFLTLSKKIKEIGEEVL